MLSVGPNRKISSPIAPTGGRLMSNPELRRYTRDHVWIDAEGRVGVSARLLEAARGVARLHLPAVGDALSTAAHFGSVELDKGVLDLYAPCDGAVLERNEALLGDPAALDADTWLLRTDGRPGPLMTAEEYERFSEGAVVAPRFG